MNKLFISIMLVMILVLPMASAWDWDNVREYDSEKKEVTITNALGFGEDLAKIKLITPDPNQVIRGKDRQVMIIEVDNLGELYENAVKNMEIKNMRDLQYVDKTSHWDYAVYGNVDVNDYEDVCVIEKNLTESCVKTLSGKHSESKIVDWVRLDTQDLPTGKTRLALVTDVEEGDYYDGIPTLFGERLDMFAVWTEALSVDLVQWFKLDEGSGNALSDSTGNVDGIYSGTANWQTGLFGNSIDNSNGEWANSTLMIPEDNSFSLSGWFNGSAPNTNNGIWGCMDTNDGPGFNIEIVGSNEMRLSVFDDTQVGNDVFVIYDESSGVAWSGSRDWQHIAMTANLTSGNWSMYFNGTIVFSGFSNTTDTGLNPSAGTYTECQSNTLIFGDGGVALGTRGWAGGIDEIGYWNRTLSPTEVTQLYNDGIGITWQPPNAAPTIIHNSPKDGYNSTVDTIDLSCNATKDTHNISGMGILVYNSSDSLNFQNTTSGFNINSINETWTTDALNDSAYSWSCQAFGTNGLNATTTNRTFTIHTRAPNITIPNPSGNILSLTNGQSLGVNWSIAEPGEDLSDHIVNCSIIYNGVTTDLSQATCIATNTSTITYASGVNVLTMSVTDKFNLMSFGNTSWGSTFSENSQTYNSSTVETSSEGFSIDINYSSSEYSVVTANLIYNGTTNLGARTGTGDHAVFKKVITIPEVESQENKTFYWAIGLTNSSGTNWFNSSANNQTIDIINMSLCGSPYTNQFINFTIFDGTTEMNGTFKSTFTYGTSGSSEEKTFSYEDTGNSSSQFNFCMSPPSASFLLTSTLEYASPGYTTKFYDFQNIIVTNTTTQKNLYLINDSDSTSFIVKVRDTGFINVPNAEVHVQRYDVGTGVWVTTEIILTNYEGKAVAHLLTEDANYRFLVYVGGTLVLESGSTKIVCEEIPCTVTLIIDYGTSPGSYPYEELSSLSTSLTYTETTNIFTYSYQDSDSDFIESRLLVQRVDVGGGDLLDPACNITLTDPSGIIICDISSTVNLNGTYVATGFNSRTGELNYQTDRIVVSKWTTIANTVGADGVLWGIFFMITIVMLGVYRPSLGIIFAMIGFLILSIMRLIDISWAAVSALILIGVILLIGVRKQ